MGLRFPKLRGTFLGVPIIRTIVFWVYIGSPYFRKLPNKISQLKQGSGFVKETDLPATFTACQGR